MNRKPVPCSPGFTILVVGAGQTVTATTELMLAGDPLMLGIVWGVFLALAVFGIVCSMGNMNVNRGRVLRSRSPLVASLVFL